MKKSHIIVIAAVAALISTASYAAPRHHINDRQQNQSERIQNGVRSGELTRAEAHNLAKDQRHINNVETRMRVDNGGLEAQERARLAAMQSRSSHEIYAKKHNSRSRAN